MSDTKVVKFLANFLDLGNMLWVAFSQLPLTLAL